MADTLAAVTDDGVLVATNSHRPPNEPQGVRWHPAADHEPGAELEVTGGGRVAQVRRTHAVLLTQAWWAWGAEAGANEHGVTIAGHPVGTRGSGSRPSGALAGPDLLRLALERAADRREAVEVLVALLEEHGQASARVGRHSTARDTSFVVADPGGVLLLETAGRRWATEEVDGACAVTDALTIAGFAEKHRDAARARLGGAADRGERTRAAAAVAASPADLMAALRGHGSRRLPDVPRWRRSNGAVAGACAHAGGLLANAQTTASWVGDLRPGRPRQAGGAGEVATHWVTGTAAPCTSVFWPARVGEAAAPGATRPLADTDDPAHLWWRHERVHRAAMRDAPRTLDPLATGRSALEDLWLAEPPTSAEALDAADAWRGAALEGLLALEPSDTRPVRVAAQWRRWSARAGMPGWGRLAAEAS